MSVIVILIVIVVGSVGSGIIIVKYNKSRCNVWFAPIKNVSEMVPELAKGNLDVEFNYDSDVEEISVLNNSLNTTVVQLRHYIEDISSVVSAVVAGEINKLANACSEASRQIGELVVETKQAVSTGRELTDATVEKLNSSISASRHFKESIEEIQSFVGEQKSSIEQINDLAQQLSQVVEQNAAVAQENAASGTELDQCAQDLRSAVNSFTTKE